MKQELEEIAEFLVNGSSPSSDQCERLFSAEVSIIEQHTGPVVAGYSSPELFGQLQQSAENITSGQRSAPPLVKELNKKGLQSMAADKRVPLLRSALSGLADYVSTCDDMEKKTLALAEMHGIALRLIESDLESTATTSELTTETQAVIGSARDLFTAGVEEILGADTNPVAVGLLSEETIPHQYIFSSHDLHYELLGHFIDLCRPAQIFPLTVVGIRIMREEHSDDERLDPLIKKCAAKMPLSNGTDGSGALIIKAAQQELTEGGFTLSGDGLAFAMADASGGVELFNIEPNAPDGANIKKVVIYVDFAFEGDVEDHPRSLSAFLSQIETGLFPSPINLWIPSIRQFFVQISQNKNLHKRLDRLSLDVDNTFLDLSVPESVITLKEPLGDARDSRRAATAPEGLELQAGEYCPVIEIRGNALDEFFDGKLNLFLLENDNGVSVRLGQ